MDTVWMVAGVLGHGLLTAAAKLPPIGWALIIVCPVVVALSWVYKRLVGAPLDADPLLNQLWTRRFYNGLRVLLHVGEGWRMIELRRRR